MAPTPSTRILLDTCAVIWLVNADPLPIQVIEAIRSAARDDGVYVSTTSAWEIGMLSRPSTRRPSTLRFFPDPKTWFARLLALPGIREATMTSAITVDASHLPGDLHGDPADRLIIATARHLNVPIVTRDHRIIAYAATGHVSVMSC